MVINKMRCHDSPHSSPLLNMSTLQLLEYILKDRSDASSDTGAGSQGAQTSDLIFSFLSPQTIFKIINQGWNLAVVKSGNSCTFLLSSTRIKKALKRVWRLENKVNVCTSSYHAGVSTEDFFFAL